MDGLEAVEVNLRSLEVCIRIDSEYYQKAHLKLSKLLAKHQLLAIGKFAKVTDGEHGSVIYRDSGVKYLTAENIKNGFVDVSNIRYVDEEVHKRNARASVNVGDVLISIKGTLGEAAIAEEWLPPANMNRDVAILKPFNVSAISSEYLALFLMSDAGKLQAIRGGSGGVQQMITLERLREFQVPLFASTIQKRLADCYRNSQASKKFAEASFRDAEQILLCALGLENWQPSNQHVAIKNFSQSFAASGRLDAEYYQPKYNAWAERIKQHPAGISRLATACQIKEENFPPDEAKMYRYIELSDIGSHGDITGATEDVGAALPTRARRCVAVGDVVVSSIEGSLQSVALVTDDYDNALCSTGFYVVRSDTINSETLLVLFKSEAYQNLFKQSCTGTILTAMPREFFGHIPVPVIDVTVQQSIAEKVQASFAARRQSQQLLELAKQAVERAIESSEAEALTWLQVQLHQIIG